MSAPTPGIDLPDPVEAWRLLPKAVRREVSDHALSGQPHPEPALSMTALAWARAARLNSRWGAKYALVGVVLAIAATVWTIHQVTGGPVSVWLMILQNALAFGTIGAVAYWWNEQGAIEVANLRAALAAGRLAPTTDVAYSGPIAHARQSRLVVIGPLFFLSTFLFGDIYWPWRSALQLAGLLTGILVLVWYFRLPPASRRVDVTDEGLAIPHLKLTVPWRDIESVDVDLIAVKRQLVAGIRWQLKDPQTSIENPRLRQRIVAAGGSVDVPFHWLDVLPEDVVASSRHRLAEVGEPAARP
jgi:hypothetical protein